MVDLITIEHFDRKMANQILEKIQNQKTLPAANKAISLVLDSTEGDYRNAIKIADAVLRNGFKIEVSCSGTLDASAAIICALAKCTGGNVIASIGTDFRISHKILKSGKDSESSNSDILDKEISKILKHLKCNMKLLGESIESGSIITADVAKKARLVTVVEKLPTVKLVAKKAPKTKTATPEAIDDSAKTESKTDDSKKEIKKDETSKTGDTEKKK